jgi:hypothetical protein
VGGREPRQELLVGGKPVEAVDRQRAQQSHGVVPGRRPQVGVDRGEEVLGLQVP